MAALCVLSLASVANAAPGVGEAVYGATIEKGVTELEARYGRLSGGPDAGEDGLVLELEHGFSDRFAGAVLAEFEREPGGSRKLEALSVEGVVHFGRVDSLGLDVAGYVEFEAVRHAADKVETKLLLQHRQGPFDARLNLIVEKELEGGEPLEFGYAASVDWAAVGEFRLGVAAFGELGSTHDFLPRAEHFAGPIVKTEIEHLPGDSEIEIEAGYLFALGAARDDADGQWRLLIGWETRF